MCTKGILQDYDLDLEKLFLDRYTGAIEEGMTLVDCELELESGLINAQAGFHQKPLRDPGIVIFIVGKQTAITNGSSDASGVAHLLG